MTNTEPTTEPIIEPGTIVSGQFFSNGNYGIGIVAAVGRPLWTRVPEGYVPVKIVTGDRIDGGYRPEGLTIVKVPS